MLGFACHAGLQFLTQPRFIHKHSHKYIRNWKNAKSRISYILLGIFLGCLGIHNFYAGYVGRAVAQLLITLFTGWLIIPWFAVWIWCIVEVCTVRVDARGIKFDV